MLQERGRLLGVVSDCEELVGAITGDDGVGFLEVILFKVCRSIEHI